LLFTSGQMLAADNPLAALQVATESLDSPITIAITLGGQGALVFERNVNESDTAVMFLEFGDIDAETAALAFEVSGSKGSWFAEDTQLLIFEGNLEVKLEDYALTVTVTDETSRVSFAFVVLPLATPGENGAMTPGDDPPLGIPGDDQHAAACPGGSCTCVTTECAASACCPRGQKPRCRCRDDSCTGDCVPVNNRGLEYIPGSFYHQNYPTP